MELNICHLYPDILNLYGDRGNILCMRKRLAWRGIDVNVDEVSIGQKLEASKYDLLFIGGGQDFEQEVLLPDLRGAKTEELKAAIEDNLPVLAICGGYQMLGQYYKTWDGVQLDFIGVIGVHTIGAKERMIGNIVLESSEFGEIVGYENHSGVTVLGPGSVPLGRVLQGAGNNPTDGVEGARSGNVIGSYLHGSLLPKNSAIADFLIRTAVERRYGTFDPAAAGQTDAQRAALHRIDEIADRARRVAMSRPR